MDLSDILKEAAKAKASDIHLKNGNPPIFRIGKELVNLKSAPLKISDIEQFIAEILPENKKNIFQQTKEIDYAYMLDGIGRFRVNIFFQKGAPGIVIRRVKAEFDNFAQLGLPSVLEKICSSRQGIVIVCGPARTGKSTTIATMLNYINATRRLHVITIEDPIEYVHEDKMSIIDQREVSIDTDSYDTAIKAALREDPDVIYIGELRDKESFNAALNAAETGHLIFTTLHATNTSHAVERILDYTPSEQRDQARKQLASNLSAIVAQQLLPKKDGTGSVPAVEVLIGTGIVQKLVRENKITKLPAAIETGGGDGMQTFNQSLLQLVQSNQITQEDALARSAYPEVLKLNLQGIFLDDAKRILET
jgi:twitching motility protein PilT